MLYRKTITAVSLSFLSMMLWVPWNSAVAVDDPNSFCDLRGSWVGGNPAIPGFIVTYDGATRNSGSKDQEFIVADPRFDLPAVEPNPCADNGAESLSGFRGVWERRKSDDQVEGPSVFDATLIGYALVPSPINPLVPLPACGIRIISTKTIAADCLTLDVDFTAEFFNPGDNPLTDAPVSAIFGTTIETRITQAP